MKQVHTGIDTASSRFFWYLVCPSLSEFELQTWFMAAKSTLDMKMTILVIIRIALSNLASP